MRDKMEIDNNEDDEDDIKENRNELNRHIENLHNIMLPDHPRSDSFLTNPNLEYVDIDAISSLDDRQRDQFLEATTDISLRIATLIARCCRFLKMPVIVTDFEPNWNLSPEDRLIELPVWKTIKNLNSKIIESTTEIMQNYLENQSNTNEDLNQNQNILSILSKIQSGKNPFEINPDTKDV